MPNENEQLEAELCKVFEAHGIRGLGLHIDKYYLEDHYFTKHRDIWDSSEYWWEDVDVDRDLWFKYEHPVTTLDFTEKLINKAEVYLGDEEYEPFIDKPYKDLPAEIQHWIDTWYDEVDIYEVENDEELQDIFDCHYPEERFNSLGSLAYWTVYFEPRRMDEDIAHQCGLLPFTWKGEYELLALCGCGMDLSPKLDAYQAMVDNTLPHDSQAFRQPSYFDYVSPFKTEEVLKRCEREEPLYTMRAVARAVA